MATRQQQKSSAAARTSNPASSSGVEKGGVATSHSTSQGQSLSESMPSAQQSVVGPSHRVPGRVAPALDGSGSGAPPPGKRIRKERGPNWTAAEISALIQAKRMMAEEESECIDKRSLMVPDSNKWHRISLDVLRVAPSHCPRDGAACKSKWNQLLPEYKRIADFMTRTGTNDMTYWQLSTADRKSDGLPRAFPQDVFFEIHDWYGVRPCMQPPHTRDLMSADDHNYNTPMLISDDDDSVPHANAEDLGGAVFNVGSDDLSDSLHSHRVGSQSTQPGPIYTLPLPTPTPSAPLAAKFSVPEGVTPQILSSSDTAEGTFARRSGNTGVRRKTVTGHSLIAEATRATGDAMATQMKEIAEAGRDLEQSKIDVQLTVFKETMEYRREHDRRTIEQAKQTNENAKLAITKQAEVVHCLTQLTQVLSAGFQQTSTGRGNSHGAQFHNASVGPSGTAHVLPQPEEEAVPTSCDPISDQLPTPTSDRDIRP